MTQNNKTLSFKDLTTYDINLVRNNAVDDYVNNKVDCPSKSLVKMVFEMIHSMGFDVVKNEERTPTWQNPRPNWYGVKPGKLTWKD